MFLKEEKNQRFEKFWINKRKKSLILEKEIGEQIAEVLITSLPELGKLKAKLRSWLD